MQLTKKEQVGVFNQLVQVVNKYPKVRTRIELFIWNMLENLPEERQERWEDY